MVWKVFRVGCLCGLMRRGSNPPHSPWNCFSIHPISAHHKPAWGMVCHSYRHRRRRCMGGSKDPNLASGSKTHQNTDFCSKRLCSRMHIRTFNTRGIPSTSRTSFRHSDSGRCLRLHHVHRRRMSCGTNAPQGHRNYTPKY